MQNVLSVQNARKSFGSTPALDGAAMSLRAGEALALLGPNGAGKTTLIRAVAGRVQLDGGSIDLLGSTIGNGDTEAAREARRSLGIVPQDFAIYPLLTAEENLLAFGALHGVPNDALRDRVRWALDWTGLSDRARSLSKTFSGGMKRRLNIACGILHRPKVVLLDEPTAGVDPQSRERIWSMLAQLRDEGASLLLTTHQLDEAQQVCERITIIDHGRTIAEGTLNELVAQTLGKGRQVTVSTAQPLSHAPEGCVLSENRRSVVKSIEDVAVELPELLGRLAAANARVVDVDIQQPSLHAVFIALTGRELRE